MLETISQWFDSGIGKLIIGALVGAAAVTLTPFFKGYFGALGKSIATRRRDIEGLQKN